MAAHKESDYLIFPGFTLEEKYYDPAFPQAFAERCEAVAPRPTIAQLDELYDEWSTRFRDSQTGLETLRPLVFTATASKNYHFAEHIYLRVANWTDDNIELVDQVELITYGAMLDYADSSADSDAPRVLERVWSKLADGDFVDWIGCEVLIERCHFLARKTGNMGIALETAMALRARHIAVERLIAIGTPESVILADQAATEVSAKYRPAAERLIESFCNEEAI